MGGTYILAEEQSDKADRKEGDMPIVIPRDKEVPTEIPVLTQEQRSKVWEQIVASWAEKHPEVFKDLMENHTAK